MTGSRLLRVLFVTVIAAGVLVWAAVPAAAEAGIGNCGGPKNAEAERVTVEVCVEDADSVQVTVDGTTSTLPLTDGGGSFVVEAPPGGSTQWEVCYSGGCLGGTGPPPPRAATAENPRMPQRQHSLRRPPGHRPRRTSRWMSSPATTRSSSALRPCSQ